MEVAGKKKEVHKSRYQALGPSRKPLIASRKKKKDTYRGVKRPKAKICFASRLWLPFIFAQSA